MLFIAIDTHSIATAMVLQCNFNSEISEPLETAPVPASSPTTCIQANGKGRAFDSQYCRVIDGLGKDLTNKTEILVVL